MTKIKFCGLCRPEDAAFAEKLGADYGGVILTDSPRKVSTGDARRIFDAAPSLKRVGVVGREATGRILDSAREAELDVLQLHAHLGQDEIGRIRQEFEGSLWTVMAIDSETGKVSPDWPDLADLCDALLLDTSVKGHSGGTGMPFNWAAAAADIREIEREIPVVLAGGLKPGNVAAAIEQLRPWAVDVSSGVEEAPGVKSHELMSAFAKAVRSASIV